MLTAQQSPLLNHHSQLITPLQQIPQSPLAWATQQNPNQLVPGSPIFIRQQNSATDGQPVFIHNSNSGALQTMPGTPIYVNHNASIMQLLPNHHHHHHHANNLNSVPQTILTNSSTTVSATNHSTITTQSKQQQQFNNILQQSSNITNASSQGIKLKTIKPAAQNNNLNSSLNSQMNSKIAKSAAVTSNKEDGHKKLSKKQSSSSLSSSSSSLDQSIDKSNKFSTKSTQQMNAELLIKQENERLRLQRCDALKSKNEMKLKKSNSLDEDSSSSSMNSKSNSSNSQFKKDKSEKKKKAIVKPQILSHCVDGYIIHESSFPFPINVTEELNDELEQIKLNNGGDKKLAAPALSQTDNAIKDLSNSSKNKLKKAKKSKLKSNTPINGGGDLQNESSIENGNSKQSNQLELSSTKSLEETTTATSVSSTFNVNNKERNIVSVAPISETSSSTTSLDESSVSKWTVEQCYEYLIKQEVSEAIAKELCKAQIDGKSLVLLTIPILKDKFMFKLGPILSLKKKIDELKEKSGIDDSLDNYLPPSGNNIYKWSVKDTYQFILNLSSKEQYADEFEKQEMDGYSLTLINLDNIIGDMNIPYGPALVIYNKIEELKKNSTNN